jgi:NAD(P)-dependent dehydrogenase (short-subunit alcohol dehydrogenase family)
MLEWFDLKGKTAVVTGASRGIGKAVALSLAEAGADVVGCARDTNALEETIGEILKMGKKAIGVKVDIKNAKDIRSMAEKTVSEFGKIDILVNNAGVVLYKPLVESSEEEWRNIIDTNLVGTFLCCREIGKYMIERKYGKVINMSSMRGFIGGPNETSYCASKGAIIQFTKALALEWAQLNINVNAVAPGIIYTEMSSKVFDKSSELREKILNVIPLRRIGTPEEVGALVVFLSSKAADFITGETIVIDGGQIIK